MKSPFALRAELLGPQTPRQNTTWLFRCALGIAGVLAVIGGALLVTP